MKVLLVGGGTLGSASPLLAVAQDLQEARDGHEVQFWGTEDGPERSVVEGIGIPFSSLSGGKLRRYWSWKNFLAPVRTIVGFLQAYWRYGTWRPDVVLTAGSFVAVPAAWAARLRRIPVVAHQQDVRVGLANRLIFPFARVISGVFARGMPRRTLFTGNPVRNVFLQSWPVERVAAAKLKRGLEEGVPVLVAVGGSTGSTGLNSLVVHALPELVKFCQVVHITGRGKDLLIGQHERYQALSFVHDDAVMSELVSVADAVASRAGMGLVSELAALGKPALLLPLPGTHQEANAAFLADQGAAVLLAQRTATPASFTAAIQELLYDASRRTVLQEQLASLIKTISGRGYFEAIRRVL